MAEWPASLSLFSRQGHTALVTGASRYVNGIVLPVDGGNPMRGM
jgi:hypothetical protein